MYIFADVFNVWLRWQLDSYTQIMYSYYYCYRWNTLFINSYFWIEIPEENLVSYRHVVGEGTILIAFLLESLNSFHCNKYWFVFLEGTSSFYFQGNDSHTPMSVEPWVIWVFQVKMMFCGKSGLLNNHMSASPRENHCISVYSESTWCIFPI